MEVHSNNRCSINASVYLLGVCLGCRYDLKVESMVIFYMVSFMANHFSCVENKCKHMMSQTRQKSSGIGIRGLIHPLLHFSPALVCQYVHISL